MSLKSIKSLIVASAISMAFSAPALADTAINIVVNTPTAMTSSPVKIKNSHRHVVSQGQHTHVKNVVIIPAQAIIVTKVVPQKPNIKKEVIRDNKPVTYSPKDYTHLAVHHH